MSTKTEIELIAEDYIFHVQGQVEVVYIGSNLEEVYSKSRPMFASLISVWKEGELLGHFRTRKLNTYTKLYWFHAYGNTRDDDIRSLNCVAEEFERIQREGE